MSVYVFEVPQPHSFPPRVRLDVTTTPKYTGPITVDRIHADGSRYPVMVTGGSPRAINGFWGGYDYHCPYSPAAIEAGRPDVPAPVTYEVSAGPVGTGVSRHPIVLTSESSWLVHPSEPELSLRIPYVDSLGDIERPSRAGVHQPIGSSRAVRVSSGSLAARKSSITLGLLAEQLPALDALVADDPALLLNLAQTTWDTTWAWIATSGWPTSVPTARARGGKAAWPYRLLAMSYAACEQPDVDLLGPWTLGRIADLGLTLGQLQTRYGLLGNFQTDTLDDLSR